MKSKIILKNMRSVLYLLFTIVISSILGVLEFNLISLSNSFQDNILTVGVLMVSISVINIFWTYFSASYISNYVMSFMENSLRQLQFSHGRKDLTGISADLTKKFTDGANRAVDGFLIPLSLLPTRIVLLISILVSTYSTIGLKIELIFISGIIVAGVLISFITTLKISKIIGNRIHTAIAERITGLEASTVGFKSYYYTGNLMTAYAILSKAFKNYVAYRPWSEVLIHLPKISLDVWLGLALIYLYYTDLSSNITINAASLIVLIRLLPNLQIIFSIINQCASNYDAVRHFFTVNVPQPMKIIENSASCSLDESGLNINKGTFKVRFERGTSILVGKSGTGKSSLLYWIFDELRGNGDDVCLLTGDPFFMKNEELRVPAEFLPLYQLIAGNGRLEKLNHGGVIVLDDVSSLSLGEKQRLAFFRAAVKRNKVYLLDECFSGIEVSMEEKILSWIEQNSDCAVLVTHRTPKLKYFTHSIATINQGLQIQ
ncbi:hypothetical protein N9Y14_00535 [Alphaproteobacteria bacterium]|nr:hypothetical protein [Alphaproteobacteria bacterium]MDB2406719.1 hypothetical protein [Alphaproteobacteria bacterium]MDB2540617.1 hypothetical protein [Alphaproteobacteria bacterium]MDB2649024.1 hypothetical protein [Alphaproteobacteria bacterium]